MVSCIFSFYTYFVDALPTVSPAFYLIPESRGWCRSGSVVKATLTQMSRVIATTLMTTRRGGARNDAQHNHLIVYWRQAISSPDNNLANGSQK